MKAPIVLFSDEIRRVSASDAWRAYRQKALRPDAAETIEVAPPFGTAVIAAIFGAGLGLVLPVVYPAALAIALALTAGAARWRWAMNYELKFALAFHRVLEALDSYPTQTLQAILETQEIKDCKATACAASLLIEARAQAMLPLPPPVPRLADVLASPPKLSAPVDTAWSEEGEKL